MNRFEFKVFGNPVAQGRPRFFRRGNFVGVYDPKTSKSWKESIRWQAIENGAKIMEGPLCMTLHFFLSRPKTLPRKILHHVKKPDIDNLAKGIKDSLRGICYRDDSQITKLIASKEYGNQPGVIISIWEV